MILTVADKVELTKEFILTEVYKDLVNSNGFDDDRAINMFLNFIDIHNQHLDIIAENPYKFLKDDSCIIRSFARFRIKNFK